MTEQFEISEYLKNVDEEIECSRRSELDELFKGPSRKAETTISWVRVYSVPGDELSSDDKHFSRAQAANMLLAAFLFGASTLALVLSFLWLELKAILPPLFWGVPCVGSAGVLFGLYLNLLETIKPPKQRR